MKDRRTALVAQIEALEEYVTRRRNLPVFILERYAKSFPVDFLQARLFEAAEKVKAAEETLVNLRREAQELPVLPSPTAKLKPFNPTA